MNAMARWRFVPVMLALLTALTAVAAEEGGKPKQASPSSPPKARVEMRLAEWAAAWSAKDFGAYSRFYAKTFVPADGATRDDWAMQRQKRLAQPATIRVEVKGVRVRLLAEDTAVTEFEQLYASDTYRDRTLKTLQWVNEDGVWLIDREAGRPVPAAASNPEAMK